MAPTVPISVPRGGTLEFGILYADSEYVSPYPVITGMPSKAPVRLQVIAHGLPDGWPIQIACVRSPGELNTAEGEWVFVKVIDDDTLELNQINAHCWKNFSGEGVIITYKPMDLTGWVFRAQVRDRPDGDVLWSWHSNPAEDPDSLIIVDQNLSQIVLTMSAVQTAALSWSKGVYELEGVAPGGQVYKVTAISPIEVSHEVTR